VVVDTTRARQLGIGQHRRKNDRIDAEVLATCLEKGLIPEAHVLSQSRQELRLLLGARRALVEARAQAITTIKGLIRARGIRIIGGNAPSFARVVRTTAVDEFTRALVDPMVRALDEFNDQIAVYDEKLEELSARDPVIAMLKTAPGVGVVVAAAFASVVDGAERFDTAHHLESYLGLVPSENTSGHRRIGKITKHGNTYLRAMLVQSALSILRLKKPDPLREWGRAVMARRGMKVAAVALARRLAGVLWAMWRDGTAYEVARVGQASAQGIRDHAQRLEYQAAAVARAARKRLCSSLRS
jgi:transposase